MRDVEFIPICAFCPTYMYKCHISPNRQSGTKRPGLQPSRSKPWIHGLLGLWCRVGLLELHSSPYRSLKVRHAPNVNECKPLINKSPSFEQDNNIGTFNTNAPTRGGVESIRCLNQGLLQSPNTDLKALRGPSNQGMLLQLHPLLKGKTFQLKGP